MTLWDRFRHRNDPPPPAPPTLTGEQLDSLPHPGAARAIREITGPLRVGQIVELSVDDGTVWGTFDVNEPMTGAFAAVLAYGAGGAQSYSFLNLELGGGRASWLALEGEGNNQLARAFLFKRYEGQQLRDDLAWVLGQFLNCEYPRAPYLLEVGGPFDDGVQKVWTAYAARHGTIRTALGVSRIFPNLGPGAEVEYQDMTLHAGEDMDSATVHLRYVALGDYTAVLVGERLPLSALKIYPHGT